MDDDLSLDSLRNAIRTKRARASTDADEQFGALARRFESAVQDLVALICKVAESIPELSVTLEDETETFTSPAFPGKEVDIEDQRVHIRLDEDYLLFDPTAQAHFTTHGQVEVRSSRPIPFLIEKTLYLLPEGTVGSPRWGYRSISNLGGGLTPFDGRALVAMLKAVFA
ncbi:MAG: hypothetical protein U0166_21050 [Acidobacteriota bacterium]